MVKKPFIDKNKASHFSIVHRSQHDPLVADGEASKHVLLPVLSSSNQKKNLRKKGLAIDDGLQGEELEKALKEDLQDNAAKAAQFGVFFGDDYDYCQHLKPMGQSSDAVFIAAPQVAKAQEKAKKQVSFQLPEEALPSKIESKVGIMNQPAIPEEYDMFMDPDVIDALEALEDEDYIETSLDDNFFSQIDGSDEEFETLEAEELDETAGWEDHFRRFKASKDNCSDYAESEDEGLPKGISKKTSASKYSMTSSAMFRNKGLTLLDEQFDRIEEEYELESEEDGCPELVELREDFDQIMDDFLDNYEVVGRRMTPRMEGDTSLGKLDHLRKAFLEAQDTTAEELKKVITAQLAKDESAEPIENEFIEEESPEARWDCESILSTYSNIYNRPAIISEPSNKTRIRINSRGFPRVEPITSPSPLSKSSSTDDDDSQSESDDNKEQINFTRAKGESKEEKKARKNLAKELKKERRETKKANKVLFQQLHRQRNNARSHNAVSHVKAIHIE